MGPVPRSLCSTYTTDKPGIYNIGNWAARARHAGCVHFPSNRPKRTRLVLSLWAAVVRQVNYLHGAGFRKQALWSLPRGSGCYVLRVRAPDEPEVHVKVSEDCGGLNKKTISWSHLPSIDRIAYTSNIPDDDNWSCFRLIHVYIYVLYICIYVL